jgi:hypothetical protein
MYRRIAIIVAMVVSGIMTAQAQTTAVADSTHAPKAQPKEDIYQGTTSRVDLLNPVLDLARSEWHTYSVEAAVNVRLKNRFYPTLEFGYADRFLQVKDAATPLYDGRGGFARIGLDINPLKKHPEQRSAFLIGVRLGTSLQQLSVTGDGYVVNGAWVADVWGEIGAGVQVDIYKGFNMGWAIRMKFLFTRASHDEYTTPYYVPGFGYWDTMNWGFNYYIGYTF